VIADRSRRGAFVPALLMPRNSPMSTVFEKLIAKYAERGDFERLQGYRDDRLAILKSIQDGTYEKVHLISDTDPVSMVAEIERELACIDAALKKRMQ
jgi:predicted ester cyclase